MAYKFWNCPVCLVSFDSRQPNHTQNCPGPDKETLKKWAKERNTLVNMRIKYPKFNGAEYAEEFFHRVEFPKIDALEDIERYLEQEARVGYEVKFMRENEDSVEFFLLRK